MIRDITENDAPSIVEIYAPYVLNSHCTFEITPPIAEQMALKIQQSIFPWLVLEEEGEILGYAYATSWKPREAYRSTVETSVYIKEGHSGKGLASTLYNALLERLKKAGLHTALAGISLPNDASVALHEKLGYKKVGELEEVGFKFDRWINVGYWQLNLENC